MENSKIYQAINFILDNLLDFATIGITAFFIVRNETNPIPPENVSQFYSWILAVLGLIAVSGVWDRNRRMNRIEKSVNKNHEASLKTQSLIQNHISGLVSVKDFLKLNNKVDDDFFSSATEIIITGITLQMKAKLLMNTIEERLKVGANVKLILLEPSETNLLQMQLKGWGKASTEHYKGLINATIMQFDILARDPYNRGKIEIGYLPFYPSICFSIRKTSSGDESCWVFILNHKTTKTSPAFFLEKGKDPEWYDFFREQFDLMWQSCRIESLPRDLSDQN